MEEKQRAIPQATRKRLPLYLSYLKAVSQEGQHTISATAIGSVFRMNQVQVRKDLAAVGQGGKPKIGYRTAELIADIERCLGYPAWQNAVLVGVGNLGKALLNYQGFSACGMNILLAFDRNPALAGSQVNGKYVLGMENLSELCRFLQVKVGIIAVPGAQAQAVCNLLTQAGVRAVWNFAPVALQVAPGVAVLNERIGEGLSGLLSSLS